MTLRAEIFEQPDVVQRVLDTQMGVARQIAAAIRDRDFRYVFIAARGTSDNAAIYAKYVWGAFNRLPVALAAPSLFTFYERPPLLRDTLVVGISQSGQSPDVVSVLAEGRRQGVPTAAITNEPGSPLAGAADFVLDIQAGQEKAVAATKTYTSSLMALAMISAALDDDETHLADLARVPAAMQAALAADPAIEAGINRFKEMTRCVVLGRGFNYATAFEWALKMKELTYVVSEPYSPADFRHGPIALAEPGFPVMVMAPRSKLLGDEIELMKTLVEKHSADLAIISDDDRALSFGHLAMKLPGDLPEWITPLVGIVQAQLFCYHLTQVRGINPEAPRGLTKVTETL